MAAMPPRHILLDGEKKHRRWEDSRLGGPQDQRPCWLAAFWVEVISNPLQMKSIILNATLD